MENRFGDNQAAKVSEEATYFIDTQLGTIWEDPSSTINWLRITSTIGSFQLTQASRLTAQTIATTELYGTVVDWGCGGGLLALLAASKSKVERVIGLDFESQNIITCRQNALQNSLQEKIEFYQSDSFEPFEESAKKRMQLLKGSVDFVIANPPASSGDDGFSFRRRILKEAMPYLKPNAKVLLQALSYYGSPRFVLAAKEASDLWNHSNSQTLQMQMEYKYLGIVQSSPWMELGAGPGGYDFTKQIRQYCREEARGGMRYFCGHPEKVLDDIYHDEDQQLTAAEAMALWERQGKTPFCQWHVHALQWVPTKNKAL